MRINKDERWTYNSDQGVDFLRSVETIAKADSQTMRAIFTDEKMAKQVMTAAKRISKKRTSGDLSIPRSNKRRRESARLIAPTPAGTERALALPGPSTELEEIRKTSVKTNRAPLVLAFAVTLLKYTKPSQPISSRLSLAQAVVSINSRSKAVSLGLQRGKPADEEGWGEGHPKITLMGRQIRVLKRWGYNPADDVTRGEGLGETKVEDKSELDGSDSTRIKADFEDGPVQEDAEPALWGLDLEALRTAHGLESTPSAVTDIGGLPIYNAQSARAYLLRSFTSAPSALEADDQSPPFKKSHAETIAECEQNLALLLGALEILYSSWSPHITVGDLDSRAWQWYVHVRPDVQQGVAGWGGKGPVHLADILDLRRKG